MMKLFHGSIKIRNLPGRIQPGMANGIRPYCFCDLKGVSDFSKFAITNQFTLISANQDKVKNILMCFSAFVQPASNDLNTIKVTTEGIF